MNYGYSQQAGTGQTAQAQGSAQQPQQGQYGYAQQTQPQGSWNQQVTIMGALMLGSCQTACGVLMSGQTLRVVRFHP